MASNMNATVSPSKVMFKLKTTKSDGAKLIPAHHNDTLATAIHSNVIPISEMNEYLFFVEINDHPAGEVVVQPMLFTCNFLKKNGNVRAVHSTRKCSATTVLDSKISSKISQPFLVFIKTGHLFRKKPITDRHYSEFDGKDMAVVVKSGEKFKESLERDGRFVDCSEWKLNCEEFNGYVDSDSEVSDEMRNCSFVCTVSRKHAKEGPAKEGPAKENVTPAPQEATTVIVQKDVYMNFIAIEDPDFTNKVRNSMEEEVKERAYSTLLDPKSSKPAGDKTILSLPKKEFSNQVSIAKPAWLLSFLGIAMRSVGLLKCGSIQATCILIKRRQIITNYHVFRDIQKQRLSSAPCQHNKIKVSFDYLDDNESANQVFVEVDEERFRQTTIVSPKLDYIILALKNHETLADRQPLGPLVRRSVPRDGLVTIIGHPQGRPKLEETCVVVPHYLWRSELQKRCQSTTPPPSGFDVGLHMCKKDIMSNNYDHRLPYDTNLFEGASGSPVFNMDGHVIGLHTQGYRLDGKSVMEFAVTFAGIVHDIKNRYGEHVAKSLFPKIANDDRPRDSLMEIDL